MIRRFRDEFEKRAKPAPANVEQEAAA